MTDHTNPMSAVRTTCDFVTDSASHVSIDMAAISTFVNSINKESTLSSLKDGVAWDANNWHYCQDAKEYGKLTCQYIFVMDALNFCFWPQPELEYDTLAMSLKAVLERDSEVFAGSNLAKIDATEIQSWFPTDLPMPNIEERVCRLQELGQVLVKHFDGWACNLVAQAKNSSISLVSLVLQYLPGFRDTCIYRGRLIHFYKRAQILVGDLWAAYGRQVSAPTSGEHAFYFTDIHELTMFADYRVPQLLRELNILKYSNILGERIDQLETIAFGSEEEVEIRACTVIAVEHIQRMLKEELQLSLLVIEVDWLLWQQGEEARHEIKPHHRTLTIYY